MNRHEYEALTARIRETWSHGGPSEKTWHEELAELDAGRAGTALARLRRSEERCPSIHRFYEAYRLVETEHSHPYERPRCATCDGNRWVPTSNERNATVVRCPDCLTTGTRNPEVERPDVPGYVEALLAELGRRRDLGLPLDDGWADRFYESWHPLGRSSRLELDRGQW